MANLTLAVDDQLLRDARKLAVDRGTPVNQMVREFLVTAVRQSSARQTGSRPAASCVTVDRFYAWDGESESSHLTITVFDRWRRRHRCDD